MYHINNENMKTDEGAKKELLALIESIDEEDLGKSMTENDIHTISGLGTLLYLGMKTGTVGSIHDMIVFLATTFWLGRQAQKEDDKAEDLLKDVKMDEEGK